MTKKLVVAAVAALASSGATAAWTHVRTRPVATPPARWTAENAAALDAEIDRLEDRLLADQARVRHWDELKTRHADVSAVACANLGEHAVAIEEFESRFKGRGADQKRRRLAAAAPASE